MLIFAYGSNLCPERLRRRVSSAEARCVASLRGHELRFHKRSSVDRSAKADAWATGDPADAVWGVVYRIDPYQKPDLDAVEGLGAGYDERIVSVEGPAGARLDAQVYVATAIDDSLRPFIWYHRYVLEGARGHGLPPEYIDRIAAHPVIRDPDRARARLHLAVTC